VSDQAQREQALDVTNSYIVQAPAGSGKTGVLTLRILKLLLTVKQPEEILAITFTKKAAAEMRVRVMEALHLASSGVAPDNPYDCQFYELGLAVLQRDRELNWCLQQNQSRLRMLTIDSFCSSIVRNRPLASGLGVNYSVADDASELYQEAARELLGSLDSDDELGTALRQVLGMLDNQFGKLSSLVSQMLAQRDHWLQDITSLHGNMDRFKLLLEASLLRLNQEALDTALEPLGFDFFRELEQVAIYASNQLAAQQIAHPILETATATFAYKKELLKLLLTKDLNPRSRLDKNGGFPPGGNAAEKREATEFKERAKALIDQIHRSGDPGLARIQEFVSLPEPEIATDQWQLLEHLVQIMRFASAHLKLVFQQRRNVDFSEIALSALAALGPVDAPSDLTLILDSKLSHILVDEFQDTSFLQVELLDRLTAGWTPGEGRSLFLVGDPMQSIYAFRKAEVGLFLRLWQQQRLGEVALTPLALTSNFRSSETVINWVNDSFSRVFPATPDIRKGAVQYAASVANKTPQPGDSVELHLFQYEEDHKDTAAWQEADWLAQTILQCPHQETIAVLVRGKSHVSKLLPVFKRQGIPYQAVDIESLSQSQVIADLLSAARALLSPNDNTAWFALLRGPWCGLTLKELQMIADVDVEHSHASAWARVQAIASGALAAELLPEPALNQSAMCRIQHLWRAYNSAYDNRHRQAWDSVLRELVLTLGIPAAARNQAELESIDLFFELLENIPRHADVPDFNQLRKKLDDLFVPPEIYPAGTRVVQVMTMHKSKGLEFDNVFLPQMQRSGRPEDKSLVLLDKQTATMSETQELFLAPFDQRTDTNKNTVYGYLRDLQGARLANETARLLYVACTRAKRRLYLSGSVQFKDSVKNPPGQSLLARIFPLQDRFATIVHEVETVPTQQEAVPFRYASEALSAALMQQAEHQGRQQSDKVANAEVTQTQPGTADAVVAGDAAKNEAGRNEAFEESNDNPRRHAGILSHRILELMVKSPGLYGQIDPHQNQIPWQRELSRMGLSAEEATSALDIVTRAVHNVQQSEHGKWLFGSARQQDAAELNLIQTMEEGSSQQLIVDRTFVENGTRYIVDYKLSEPGQNRAAFLEREIAQYSAQLNRYNAVLNAINPLPTRLFLYFPLIDHLQEVAVQCP